MKSDVNQWPGINLLTKLINFKTFDLGNSNYSVDHVIPGKLPGFERKKDSWSILKFARDKACSELKSNIKIILWFFSLINVSFGTPFLFFTELKSMILPIYMHVSRPWNILSKYILCEILDLLFSGKEASSPVWQKTSCVLF